MTAKHKNGAFVFSRARGLQPRDPAELKPLALKHGLEATIIPSYAGDRAAIGRAIQQTSSGLYREGWLLRPIKRNSSEVIYAVVKETKNAVTERVDHEQRDTLRWSAEPGPAVVECDHPIAQRVSETFQAMRGKVVTEDWSSSITTFLEAHDAVSLRRDGRIYWLAKERLDAVRKLQNFLKEVVGIDLFVAELEAGAEQVVSEVVRESVAEQLEALEAEVQLFDGQQRPSTYQRRLDEYQRLRERAMLYQSALGVGVERTHEVLAELEQKVAEMLELRKSTVVHRDGSVDQVEEAATTDVNDTKPSLAPVTLRFAGAEFAPAYSDEAAVLRFVSDDEFAKSSVASLGAMGLAGRWQKAGPVEVSIENHGPPGEAVQICLKVPSELDLTEAAKPLASIGIELCH